MNHQWDFILLQGFVEYLQVVPHAFSTETNVFIPILQFLKFQNFTRLIKCNIFLSSIQHALGALSLLYVFLLIKISPQNFNLQNLFYAAVGLPVSFAPRIVFVPPSVKFLCHPVLSPSCTKLQRNLSDWNNISGCVHKLFTLPMETFYIIHFTNYLISFG